MSHIGTDQMMRGDCGGGATFICHSVVVSFEISPEAAKLQTNKGSGVRG
jgi:hypothetical protein